ncbi:heme-binding protein [Roseivirga ehrenbergii]|uniref:Haem-binding domain-containing protein n=3 Tax=Roseivirga TaxID=290180 RepID=A0A0L8AJ13_9BACT|nr:MULTISPECIES: heme-binding domain-containing protein [Roseivirga]KOF02231.1 hypothetical protein OB69_13445 [Roseivirga seohaensis subsp. aquiponti]KYG71977.1 hypothetical protein MB14_07930 [Roseivirga ehrenbergii]KYG80927.1 hypothetical protein AWW67_08895 [Roseivirga seohaensis]TCL13193.1 heme-binding protein [Roseivirga ehrenbergii]
MKKILRYILLFILFAFVVIQFINRPEKISEPVTDNDIILSLNIDDEIAAMLKTSCYDCHSDQPRYPWYSNVAPLSWWIGDHIEHGRDELNFSLWGTYTARRRDHKLEEVVELVEKREMPLPNYLPMHKDAELSDEQIEKLRNWANAERANIAAETEN